MSIFDWFTEPELPEETLPIEELPIESYTLTKEEYQSHWGQIDQRLAADARYIDQKCAERRERWAEERRGKR